MAEKKRRKLINVNVDWQLFWRYFWNFCRSIKWPVTVIIVALLLRPEDWSKVHFRYNANLILNYINALKWPVVALITLAIIKPHLPELFKRLRKFNAGPVGGELAPPTVQATDSEQINALKSDNEESGEAATETTPSSTNDLDTLLRSDQAKIAYEQVYGAIFGSQLSILKRLYNNISTGLTQEQLMDIYHAHVASSESPYPSFIHFIQFLLDNTLVLFDATTSTYNLTNAGLYFLIYLTETNRFELFKPF